MRRDSDRIAELRREIDANPHSRQFYQLGELLRREGRFEEAAAVLRRGLQHWPKYVAAWVSLGRAELERGAPEGAMAALERAIELDPENPVAWRLLAEGRESAGDLERALGAMRRASALVPGDETLLQAVERLQARAAARVPGPPMAGEAELQVEPAVAAGGEELDGDETAVMPAGSLPVPEPFAAPGVQPAPAPPVAEEEVAPLAMEEEALPPVAAEVFQLEDTPVEEAFPGEPAALVPEATAETAVAPFLDVEPEPAAAEMAPPPPVPPPFEEEVEEAGAEPWEAVPAAGPVAAVESGPAPPAEPAASAVMTLEPEPLAGPFGELETPPPAPLAAGAPPGDDVFGLGALGDLGAGEDVFGPAALVLPAPEPPAAAPEEAVALPPVAPEPPPPVGFAPEPPPAVAEVSPWATQVRAVLPVPPPRQEAAPAPELLPVPAGELAAEAVTELAGEPIEELWPPVGEEVGLPPGPAPVPEAAPSPPPAPAPPVASVEAARALIRAERLSEALEMLEQLVEEHGEDGEARDLLELVRDMLEPMPVELPPPSLRARKIAALQRWLASLTLARERAAL